MLTVRRFRDGLSYNELGCNGCHNMPTYTSKLPPAILEQHAREHGWAVGKFNYHLCPQCKSLWTGRED